jgi:protein-disulfide isomerase
MLFFLVMPAAFAGAPIPARLSVAGWELGTAGAPLRLEIYGDFQCGDTKAAWTGVLAQFRQKYASEVSIIFHAFPLPYHKNGFDSAQAAMVMGSLAPSGSFAKIADALFAAQDKFQTDATVNITQARLFSDIFAPIATSLGISKASFLDHMNNADMQNGLARVQWKYGAASGVSGTPTFAANGVIADELAEWTLAQWEAWVKAGTSELR